MKITKSKLPKFILNFLNSISWSGRKFFYIEQNFVDLFKYSDYTVEKYYGFNDSHLCTGQISSCSNDSAPYTKGGLAFHNSSNSKLPIPPKCYILKISQSNYGSSVSIYYNPSDSIQISTQ